MIIERMRCSRRADINLFSHQTGVITGGEKRRIKRIEVEEKEGILARTVERTGDD